MAKAKETEKSEKQVAPAVNGHAANGSANGKASTPLADLMRIIGGTGRFDPLPPDQHRWQARDSEPPKHRMWSWMIGHTVARRSPQAIDDFGHDLHLNDMAKDLGMDPANVRFNWRLGVRNGLWRNGDKDEGPQRLYLKAAVGDLPDEDNQKGEEKAQEVCANLFPSSIFKKIKDWPPERLALLESKWRAIGEIDRELNAALMAARRNIIEQAQYTLLADFGVKHKPQEHRKKSESEEEAKNRRDRVQPLLPALANFVQSLVEAPEKLCADSEKNSAHKKTELAQTRIYKELEFRDLEGNLRPNGQSVTAVTTTPAPAGRPDGDSPNTDEEKPALRVQITEYLRQFKIASPLDPRDVDRITEAISSEKLLGQFKEATSPEHFKDPPRKWILLIRIAERVAKDGERYQQAGLLERKPVSRFDQKVEAFEQRMREERARAN